MKPYVIFDLDGTLAEPGCPCLPANAALLRRLEEQGARIVLSSGKPTYYLCGFARQLGITSPILIGENGGVLQVGIALPPPLYREAALPDATKEGLAELRRRLEKAFPDAIWYQPNATALTPFPHRKEDFPAILALIRDFITPEMELSVYEHFDCFDIEYAALSKGYGVQLLSRVTGADPKDMISVGDWTNDYSMFAETGYSVGIHLPDPSRATVNFPSLTPALEHILERIS